MSKRKPHGNGFNPNWEFGATQRALGLLGRRKELLLREQGLASTRGRIQTDRTDLSKDKRKPRAKPAPQVNLEALFKKHKAAKVYAGNK